VSRTTFITLLSIVILVLASLAHWRSSQLDVSVSQQQQRNDEADFFMLNAVTTQFSSAGKVDHRLMGDEVKHFPVNDFTTGINPDVTLFNTDGTVWHISAEQGRLTENNNIIELWNNVVLKRDTPPNVLNLKTSKLTVVVSQNLVHTERDVVITDSATRINATGMKAYTEEGKIKFLSNVRVTHDPAKVN